MAAKPPPPNGPPPKRTGAWLLLPPEPLLLGNTPERAVATSVGLAWVRWNTRISVSASALESMALMISTMCRMLAWVSVITMELPAELATKVACGEMKEARSLAS